MSALTVGKKFALTVGGLLAGFVALGAVSLYDVGKMNDITNLIVSDPMPGIGSIVKVRGTVVKIRGDVWRHLAFPDAAMKSKVQQEIEDGKGKLYEQLKAYETTIHEPEDTALFAQLRQAMNRYLEAYPAVVKLSQDGKVSDALARNSAEAEPAFDALYKAVATQISWNERRGNELAAESAQRYSEASLTIYVVLALCLLVGGSAAFVMIRHVNKVLRLAVRELMTGAGQVASGVSQLSAASQSLAQGSSEQAAALEETSATSEQINSMSHRNADNVVMISEEMKRATEAMSDSSQRLDQMMVSMREITDSSGRISRIIKAIDEIAFQTNILALNAAVEAARAGEAGMGFAVVAEEVRNLAQRSAQAASDTAKLIEEMIEKSSMGSRHLDLVAEGVRNLVNSASSVKTMVELVNSGTQEQTRGVDHVARSIAQIEQVTQNNAAIAEQSSSAVAQLSAAANTVREVVGQLTALVDSERAMAPAR
ncbi:MAG: MCP four helix bundle domain-containing protein [Acidobacteria bacterium]|nr:MCP four helix bundle domain-containing protein [Acidobacteriota bacterium]